MNRNRGLYIHIPFCVQKCNYCAFLSFDAFTAPRKEYTDALIEEIRLRGEALGHPSVDTVYVGGGTPSVLDVSQMRDIMTAVRRSFDIKADAEITIEANPATLGRKDGVMLAKLQAYKYLGFNRLSMGVQSMDNSRLHYLGRIHTAENVARDMEIIRRKGFDNVNLDLIFSVPGTSKADALSDLKKILEFGPEHVSCYSLQIEEGTPFGRMAERGELTEVSDEEDRETYHAICRMLEGAGYEHYEISNFAKAVDGQTAAAFDNKEGAASPYRSRHNSLYWDMSEYIGLGLGASGFVNGVRYKNTPDIEEYFRLIGGDMIPESEQHINTAFDNISEAVFTGLRRREGITYEDAVSIYLSSLGSGRANPASADPRDAFWEIFSEAEREARSYADRGLLLINDSGLSLTEQGIDISNSIMSLFV